MYLIPSGSAQALFCDHWRGMDDSRPQTGVLFEALDAGGVGLSGWVQGCPIAGSWPVSEVSIRQRGRNTSTGLKSRIVARPVAKELPIAILDFQGQQTSKNSYKLSPPRRKKSGTIHSYFQPSLWSLDLASEVLVIRRIHLKWKWAERHRQPFPLTAQVAVALVSPRVASIALLRGMILSPNLAGLGIFRSVGCMMVERKCRCPCEIWL